MNIYCQDCGLRRGADEAVFRVGGYDCPVCGGDMRGRIEDIPPPPPGFDQFDHTFTPEQAALIVSLVPEDAHHWRDIPRKAPRAIGIYTELMRTGKWRDETLERGFFDHPIRFDQDGYLTHGIMRLIACRDSGVSFRACVYAPEGFLQELFDAG